MRKTHSRPAGAASEPDARAAVRDCIVRPVELLVGVRAIAAFLKVSQAKARVYAQSGAPVARDERGVLRAEKAELWAWCRERDSRRESDGCPQ